MATSGSSAARVAASLCPTLGDPGAAGFPGHPTSGSLSHVLPIVPGTGQPRHCFSQENEVDI